MITRRSGVPQKQSFPRTSRNGSFPSRSNRKVQDRVVQEERDRAISERDYKQILTIVAKEAFKAG